MISVERRTSSPMRVRCFCTRSSLRSRYVDKRCTDEPITPSGCVARAPWMRRGARASEIAFVGRLLVVIHARSIARVAVLMKDEPR